MESTKLLNAIVEVSQAVARMPCPPEEKEEVLDKVKTLFSCYNTVAVLIANVATSVSSYQKGADGSETLPKESCGAAAGSAMTLQKLEGKIQHTDSKLSVLEQKLKSLTDRENQESDSLSSMKAEFTTQLGSLSQLRDSQDRVCNRVSHIENRSNELELLKTRLDQLHTRIENHQDTGTAMARFQKEMDKVNHKISKGLQECDIKTRAAFSAEARTNSHLYKACMVIQFTNVRYNNGDCFVSAGSFFKTCSFGLYFFASSINTNSDGDFTAAIVHNSDEVASFGTAGKKDHQTGSSIILMLRPGDMVCVKVTEQTSSVGVEIGGGFSNFVGCKLA